MLIRCAKYFKKNMKIFILYIIILFSSADVLFSETASVTVTDLRIREEPFINSPILAYITEDDNVEIIAVSDRVDTIKIKNKNISDKWYKIETLAGINGWVFGGALNKKHVISKIFKRPKIKGIGEARLWRRSNKKNPENISFSLPPWEKIEIIQAVFFLSEPTVGNEITLISKEGFIPAFKSIILEKRLRKDPEDLDIWWEIDIKQIIHPAWKVIRGNLNRASEYPSDFFIIYPAVEYSKVVSSNSLQIKDIPKNILRELIVTAIDLTGDNKPDIIEYEFHCKKPKNKDYNTWDYTCTHIYQKSNDIWILIKKIYPA